ncbi:hypothetical protein DUD43_07520 [Alcaligenes faecalis]|nr:hypothetical protein [Providencia rettgeri]MBX7031327.1 hypothetical protein [Alcaligenes faecalis]QFY77546.1 hypothetical protein DUD43_07520 [Alcaligenes faecalis]
MRNVSLFQDGRLHAVVSGSAEFVVRPTLRRWPCDWVEGIFDESWLLEEGVPRKRQPYPALLDGLVLQGVCPNSVVMIEGEQYECPEGGDIDLSFQFPGTYEVTVSCWPYLDGSYTVENPPPAK